MPNPFFYAGKIEDPACFVGRQNELKRIFGALETTHTGQVQHISIVGPRRIGKSSLLAQVIHIAPRLLPGAERCCFVSIDLTDARCHTLAGLTARMIHALGVDGLPDGSPLERLTEAVESFQAARGQTPVFCLDEFERLSGSPQEFPDTLYDAWRSLGANNRCAFLVASQASLHDLAGQGRLTSSFFNIFTRLELGELPEREARQLVERGLNCDRPFTLRECNDLLRLAGSHPYRLQVAASLLYQAKSSPPVDWRALEKDYRQQNDFIFAPPRPAFGQRLSIAGRDILRWPAWIGRFILELFGRKDFSQGTALLLGYVLLLLLLALAAGWLSPELIKQAWLFFNR